VSGTDFSAASVHRRFDVNPEFLRATGAFRGSNPENRTQPEVDERIVLFASIEAGSRGSLDGSRDVGASSFRVATSIRCSSRFEYGDSLCIGRPPGCPYPRLALQDAGIGPKTTDSDLPLLALLAQSA
jgi:hypothetical protein